MLAFDKLRPRRARQTANEPRSCLSPSKGAMLAIDKLRARHAPQASDQARFLP